MFYIKKIIHFFLPTKTRAITTGLTYYNNNSKKIIISFSGYALHNFPVPELEFFNLTKYKVNILFVQDLTDSWFNNIDINKIKKIAGNKECYCIGNSMGAFNAVMFAKYHKVKKVLGFNPQYSIHPNHAPFEKNYINAAARIRVWRDYYLKFNTKTKYKLYFGDDLNEKHHMLKIPKYKNVDINIIKNSGHDAVLKLKKNKELYKIIKKFFKLY